MIINEENIPYAKYCAAGIANRKMDILRSLVYLPTWLFLTRFISLVFCLTELDPWAEIRNTSYYGDLATCAKPCLLGVNEVVSCLTCGCVCDCGCSNHIPVSNFRASYTEIFYCVQDICQDEELVQQAVVAFRDICADVSSQGSLPTSSTSRPANTATMESLSSSPPQPSETG